MYIMLNLNYTIMKTDFVYFRSANDLFRFPCFGTNLSRELIISYIFHCPSALNGRDILDYQFQFVGPYRADSPRSRSRVYRIDTQLLDNTAHIGLLPVPKSESYFK